MHPQGYAKAREAAGVRHRGIAVTVREGSGRFIGAVNCSSASVLNDLQALIASQLDSLRVTASRIERGTAALSGAGARPRTVGIPISAVYLYGVAT